MCSVMCVPFVKNPTVVDQSNPIILIRELMKKISCQKWDKSDPRLTKNEKNKAKRL